MLRHDLLFETDRFNLTEVGPHFINDICFGEDLAAWLRARLAERGVAAGDPGQEDWGWYLEADYRGRHFLIGVGGNADETAAAERRNWGEWRVIIDPQRTMRERLRGLLGGAKPNDEATGEELQALIRGILEAQPDFRNVHAE